MHEEIIKSEALIQWLDTQIDGLEFPNEERTRLASSCLDVALEHQRAIVLLIANKLYGSAFSLIRIIFESFVRGVWLQMCATNDELEKYKTEKIEKKFGTLIEEIEQCEGFKNGILSAAKTENWKHMNSFTHSGFSQSIRRSKEDSIEPNYTKDEIREVLNVANALGMLSALQITILANKQDLSIQLLEKMKTTFNNKP